MRRNKSRFPGSLLELSGRYSLFLIQAFLALPAGTAPDGYWRARARFAARTDLVDPLSDHRAAGLGIESGRDRRTVDPAKLDLVRCFTRHRQQASVNGSVVTSAQ